MRIPLPAGLLFFASLAVADEVTVIDQARIETMDPARPRAEAMAFDADGKILALGTSAELAARYPDARRAWTIVCTSYLSGPRLLYGGYLKVRDE